MIMLLDVDTSDLMLGCWIKTYWDAFPGRASSFLETEI